MKMKVKLPCDRTGTPIRPGDVIAWDDGTRLHVQMLEWYGGDIWVANDVESGEYSDALECSIIVGNTRP